MRELLTYMSITKALVGMAKDSFLSLSHFFFFFKKDYDTCHLKGVEALKLHTPFVSKT